MGSRNRGQTWPGERHQVRQAPRQMRAGRRTPNITERVDHVEQLLEVN